MSKTIRFSLLFIFLAGITLSILFYFGVIPQYFRTISYVITSMVWIWTVVDIARNKVYNKPFWLLSMVLVAPLATIAYLIQREHLHRLGEKFGTKGYRQSNFDKKQRTNFSEK